ncbi:MAG: rhodanese-like domain-containing protein [Myxococcota bacterium]
MVVLWSLVVACGGANGTNGAAPVGEPVAAAPVAAAPAVRSTDSAALKSALDSAHVPILVDVRTPEEFASGHVPGAKSIPLNQLMSELGALEPYKGGEVWLICESGGRSARAAAQLSSQGFTTVNVGDGTSGWRNAGFPLDK